MYKRQGLPQHLGLVGLHQHYGGDPLGAQGLQPPGNPAGQLVHPGVGGVALPPQGQGKRAQPALVRQPPQLVPDALCQGCLLYTSRCV